MKPLGVGVVYAAELLPLLLDADKTVSVIEVEPQTLWRRRKDRPGEIALDSASVESIHALPQARIAHGVGMPIGGSVRPSSEELDCLAQSLDVIRPAWFSEHLSFNRTRTAAGSRMAGFLLPPRQVEDTVAVAAQNIRALAARLGLPVAFETGVNYLKISAGEMKDSDFFASVARCADCGIVLDLHNLWVNERNGRQPWREVVASLPIDRIWEIHVAGGTDLDGFALDSHSGLVPEALIAELQNLLNRLPCVGAVIFEVLPTYVPRLGLDAIARQLQELRNMWDRRTVIPVASLITTRGELFLDAGLHDRVHTREMALVSKLTSSCASADEGVALYRRLIADFRSGTIAQCLPASIALLFMTLGKGKCETLMSEYLRCTDPQAFAEDETMEFCRFIGSQQVQVPFLREVMGLESAIIETARGGVTAAVEFEHDPEQLFTSILAGKLPPQLPKMANRVYIERRDAQRR